MGGDPMPWKGTQCRSRAPCRPTADLAWGASAWDTLSCTLGGFIQPGAWSCPALTAPAHWRGQHRGFGWVRMLLGPATGWGTSPSGNTAPRED